MDMVRFSSVGYESLLWNSGQRANPVIELNHGTHEIDELTIEYYEKPVDMASNISVSYIPADRLASIPVATIDNILQGAASGVHVTRNSGMPGASLQVKIRGNHSLINSDPVYYLDGNPIQQTSIHAISPHDIESVEVLKDAASASKFGESAGNGVILLNSRKGSFDKPAFSMKYSFGLQYATDTLDLMNTDEFLEYFDLVKPFDTRYDLLDSLYKTNPMELMFQRATAEDFHLSFSGGHNNSVVYTSAGYFRQSAVIGEMDLKRYSFTINSDHAFGAKLSVGQDLFLSHVGYEGLKEGCFLNDYNNPILSAMCMLPLLPPTDSTPITIAPEIILVNPNDHPELANNSRKNYVVLGNVHTSFIISPRISFKTRLGIELKYQDNISFCKYESVGEVDQDNPYVGSEYTILDLAFNWQSRLEYDVDLPGGHYLKAVAGFEYGQSNNRWNLVDQSFYDKDLNLMTNPSVSIGVPLGIYSPDRDYLRQSFLGAVNYSYRDKYFLEGLLKRDEVGYYNMDKELNKLPGIYPSVNFGWVFTEEDFLMGGSLVHYGKIRYGWGRAGNTPRMDYDFYARMMRDMEFIYAFNSGGKITNSATKRQNNGKFYMETTSAHNVGLDLGLFRNRLFISVDYFNNHLRKGDQPKVDKPPLRLIETLNGENNFGIIELPAAKITNKGLEYNLNYRQTGRRLKWEFNVHFMHLRNKIVAIDKDDIANLNDIYVDPISVNLPGETAGSFYGYKIDRLFTDEDCEGPTSRVTKQPTTMDESGIILYAQPGAQAGDYKFIDLDQNGIIDQNDKTILGNPFPDFTFGLYSHVQFLEFDFSVLLQGTYGNEIFNATNLWLYNPYGLSNWTRDIENSYRYPKYDRYGKLIVMGFTDTDLHRIDYTAANKNLRVSDFYIEDGSYLRVKNIQLGYTLKSEFTRKIHVENIRIFICAQNLWTFTNYSGLDPEVGGWGIDCGIYPQPRTYMAGINIGF